MRTSLGPARVVCNDVESTVLFCDAAAILREQREGTEGQNKVPKKSVYHKAGIVTSRRRRLHGIHTLNVKGRIRVVTAGIRILGSRHVAGRPALLHIGPSFRARLRSEQSRDHGGFCFHM